MFRARDARLEATRGSLFGLDVIMAGHLAQAAPIGDDPVYKSGACKEKGLNLSLIHISEPTRPY